jgi:hypothetical protein
VQYAPVTTGDITNDHIGLYERLGTIPGAEFAWLMMTPETVPNDFAGILHLQATHNEVRLVPIAVTELDAHFDADTVKSLIAILDLVNSDPGGEGFTVVYALGEVLPGDGNTFVMRPQTDGTALLVPTAVVDLTDEDVLFAAATASPLDAEASSFLGARRLHGCWHNRGAMGPTSLDPCHGYP